MRILHFAFAGFAFALFNIAHAQSFVQSDQSAQISESAEPDSVVAVTAEAYGLERLAPQDVPVFGTFWEFYPNGLSAPLPCPPLDITLPIYQVSENVFLVDQTFGRVSLRPTLALTSQSIAAAVEAQGNAIANLIEQTQEADFEQSMAMAFGMESSSYDSGVAAPVFTTNQLWLQIITVTNRTASLVIHPPWNVTNAVYDLYYSTNLLASSQWRWRLRTDAGQTNVLVANATNAQGFYRIGPPDDLVANDSLGTNFWLAFCALGDPSYSHDALSLYISSPVGATGTVTTPGIGTNGPVLIVTNAGEAGLNGTYLRTNMTGQVLADWTSNSPYGIPKFSYVKGTNWVVYDKPYNYWFIVEYDGITGNFTLFYYSYSTGENPNGGAANWVSTDGSNPPTTICAPIPFSRAFSLAAGAVTNITLLPETMMQVYDVVTTKSIHVTASAPVSVYGVDYYPHATSAFTGYPVSLLGTNYCLMARPTAYYGGDGINSELAIVATADNTTVTITPSSSADLAGHSGTNAYTVILHQGQTYQINSDTSNGAITNDVTGTRIVSDKPIAVLAGVSLAEVPDGDTSYANPLVQQQLPADSWGKQALAVGFAGRFNGDSYRVLAAYANTVIWTNGVVAGTNQAGQFLDFIFDGPVEFRGSQPIQVAQFANGAALSGSPGDPAEIPLPPTGHYLMTNTVFTLPNDGLTGDFDENYINVIVGQSAITNTCVDGINIAPSSFMAIGTSGYFGARVTVTNSGPHKVTSSQPVGVQVYGWGDTDAYGYFGGVVK